MPTFISYSHENKAFVDKLAAHLVKHRARVWVDYWELNVGDSIVERVQDAIKESSALIVVLSQAAVESQWCKKELSAGLIRELEEKRVVVLPVLMEDCEIPLFLKDKLYADFRSNFDEGLRVTLEAIAKANSDTLGRSGSPENHADWGIDFGFGEAGYFLRVTLAEFARELPYTVITEIVAVANEQGTKRHRQYEEAGVADFGRLIVVTALSEFAAKEKVFLVLGDSQPQEARLGIYDPGTGISYEVLINARRLGEVAKTLPSTARASWS